MAGWRHRSSLLQRPPVRARLSPVEGGRHPGIPRLHHLHQGAPRQRDIFPGAASGITEEQPGEPAGGATGGGGSLDDVQGRLLLSVLQQCLDHGDKYHIRVASSRSPLGPFHRGHTPVITTDWDSMQQGHNCSFVAPGHGSVVDVDGEWWLYYHAWINGKMNSEPGRLMMMDKIDWQDGWPLVGVPSDGPRPGPLVPRARRGRAGQARTLFFSRPERRVRPRLRLRPTFRQPGRFYPGRSRTRAVR